MKPLYTEIEFLKTKTNDKLLCECYYCAKSFKVDKRYVVRELKLKLGHVKFCSNKCSTNSYINKQKINCSNCKIEFEKHPNQIKRSNNHFCSQKCSGSYNNKHKSHGNRRSKLEIWLEEQLSVLYPNLYIDYNKTSAIQAELDIYIPSLNLAFELNGIFHYEPIYGVDKLKKTQFNDQNKFKLCIEHMIDLCVIDSSSQKYVKPSTSQKYLDIINNIIKERI
jgi:hypothetical protein